MGGGGQQISRKDITINKVVQSKAFQDGQKLLNKSPDYDNNYYDSNNLSR